MLCPRLIGRLALALMLGAAPALAQDPDTGVPERDVPELPPSEPIAAPPPEVEAIEVTGERLDDTNVQDEAQAITAFSGADLDRANIMNVDSLQFNVPGLHVGQSANAPIITLRGIGTENSSLTGEPGVAFHVDGINYGRPSAARVAFFDLETLDVKRGPQGLLGGKNSTSGSINLVTRKPTDEYEVGGDVLFGNYDRVRIRGAVNVPFGEFAAARFAMYQENRDGFLDNVNASDSEDPFDVDDFGLRAHLRLNPTDNYELLLSYNYYKQDGVGPQADSISNQRSYACNIQVRTLDQRTGKILAPVVNGLYLRDSVLQSQNAACWNYQGTPVFVPGKGIEYHHPLTGELIPLKAQNVFDPATEDDDPRKIYLDTSSPLPEGQRNRFWGWTITNDWDAPAIPALGETHLKVLGGFQKVYQSFGQDFDATDRPLSGYYLHPDEADQYTGEVDWTGTGFDEKLEWQGSLFYMHEMARRNLNVPGLIPGVNQGVNSEQTTNNQSFGAGLHGSMALTDALSWSLGGRWIRDDRHTRLFREDLASTEFGARERFRSCHGALETRQGLPGEPANVPVRQNRSCDLTFRGTMWGTGLEWRPFGDDHLLYAKLDRGFKGGGFRAGTVGTFDPERIWAYALGTKSEFWDQRLRLNLEGFFYSYDDLQLVILDGFALRTENTDARMWGWDLEANLSPIDGLNLQAVVAYLRTETLDYFSLDPASIDSIQDSRLGNRELAESRAAEGSEGAGETNFALLECTAAVGTVPCGFYGDQDGLDDFSGNELSRSPRWKLTFSGDYEIPLGRFGSLTPRIQYTWQDDTYFRAFNTDFDLQEAYHLTNAKVVWTSPEQRWSVEAFIDNIEDEAAKQNILVGPRGFGAPPFAWYNPPRFYGIQVGFKY
jgi:iron complex outermembrane receptor protein